MLSKLTHYETYVSSPRRQGEIPAAISTRGYLVHDSQESATSAVNEDNLGNFSGVCCNLGDMHRVMQSSRLPLYHAAMRCWLAFLFGLMVLLAQVSLVVADDNELNIKICSGLVPRNIQFSTLTIADGLSQAAVNSIAQDQHGFMWFGTQEGLNRYDGYEFTTYYHDPAEPSSLSHDWVWTVFVDNAGHLWIGTDGGGLSRYEPDSNSFTHFRHNPADPTSLSHDRVRIIYEDQKGILWIGTDGGGLNRFNPVEGSFAHYRHDTQVKDSLSNDKVVAILEDQKGVMWIGTDGGGLSRFDRKSQKFIHFHHDPSRSNSRDTLLRPR